MWSVIRVAPAVSVLVIAAGGCGAAPVRHPSRAQAAVQQAQTTHEYPSTGPARPQAVSGGAGGAEAAIDAFVTVYINWSAGTVAAQMHRLAQASIGQARSAMILAAVEAGGDYELQRGGVSNAGTVESVAPRRGHPSQYVVVTRELTTATDTTVYEGLRPAWHVALATVTRLPGGGWVLSGWQPEN